MSDRFFPSLLATLVVPALLGCGTAGEPDETSAPLRTLVTVAPVEETELERVERAVGTVRTFADPMVAAEVAGRIVGVHVDVGDMVRSGQVLAELDTEPFELDLERARAERARLDARARRLEMELERLERMGQRDYVSESDLDVARAELESVREERRGAEAAVRDAERRLRETRISAPMDGLIDERRISVGDYVAVGAPAFRIAPADRFQVRLPFPQHLDALLEPGQTVRLTARAGGTAVEGRVGRLRPLVDDDSQAVEAVVEFANPGNWRPGMTVIGEIVVERREGALRVPRMSVVDRPGRQVVYVVKDGVAHERVVTPGITGRDWIEIRSGVEAGEQVAVDGAYFLTDETPVRLPEEG